MSSYDTFKTRLAGALDKTAGSFGNIGKILVEADADLKNHEYEALKKFLKSRGLTDADITMSIAVAKGELDPKLFFSGVANSKILSLSKTDQQRIIGEERFPLKQRDGSLVSKTWGEMDPDERNQLLGPKGGHIHTSDEQRLGRASRASGPTEFENVSFDGETLTLAAGDKVGKIQLGALMQCLVERGAADKLVRAVNEWNALKKAA